MKLYHGTGQQTSPFTMYFTSELEEAKRFALGINDLGNYNRESYIYSTEIEESEICIEEDFDTFDCLAYENKELEGYSRVVFNPQAEWYIVKNPLLKLEEHYTNEL